jgi:ribonuclease T2
VRPSALALIAFAASLAGTAETHAQAYQCQVPQGPLSSSAIAPDGPARRAPVTGYTLALSWSPEFCRGKERETAHKRQCGGQAGRFGLIVHGLWPEGKGGNWPQWCGTAKPDAEALRPYLCMMPSERMMAHEWAKHGSCMVRRPENYFKVSAILWRSLRLPDLDLLSRRKGLDAATLRNSFVAANPGWKPDQVGLLLSRNGWLEEIMLCYGKDFMPARCDARRYGPKGETPVKIWRGL